MLSEEGGGHSGVTMLSEEGSSSSSPSAAAAAHAAARVERSSFMFLCSPRSSFGMDGAPPVCIPIEAEPAAEPGPSLDDSQTNSYGLHGRHIGNMSSNALQSSCAQSAAHRRRSQLLPQLDLDQVLSIHTFEQQLQQQRIPGYAGADAGGARNRKVEKKRKIHKEEAKEDDLVMERKGPEASQPAASGSASRPLLSFVQSVARFRFSLQCVLVYFVVLLFHILIRSVEMEDFNSALKSWCGCVFSQVFVQASSDSSSAPYPVDLSCASLDDCG
jgi:hypothetical protein